MCWQQGIPSDYFPQFVERAKPSQILERMFLNVVNFARSADDKKRSEYLLRVFQRVSAFLETSRTAWDDDRDAETNSEGGSL